MNPQNEPEVLLKEIHQLMEECDVVFNSGETADLTHVEDKIKDFCLVVADMSAEEAANFQDDMQELVTRLTGWSDKLLERKHTIEQGLQQLNTQSKGQTAYIKNSVAQGQTNDNTDK